MQKQRRQIYKKKKKNADQPSAWAVGHSRRVLPRGVEAGSRGREGQRKSSTKPSISRAKAPLHITQHPDLKKVSLRSHSCPPPTLPTSILPSFIFPLPKRRRAARETEDAEGSASVGNLFLFSILTPRARSKGIFCFSRRSRSSITRGPTTERRLRADCLLRPRTLLSSQLDILPSSRSRVCGVSKGASCHRFCAFRSRTPSPPSCPPLFLLFFLFWSSVRC